MPQPGEVQLDNCPTASDSRRGGRRRAAPRFGPRLGLSYHRPSTSRSPKKLSKSSISRIFWTVLSELTVVDPQERPDVVQDSETLELAGRFLSARKRLPEQPSDTNHPCRRKWRAHDYQG